MGGEGGGGENMAAKPKAPRVKKEKKEPGQCRNPSVTQRLSQCAAVKMMLCDLAVHGCCLTRFIPDR